ncbi:hypothetical protein EVAR_23664_1 [Eumeta japonica]|uniref:Uncharacterized protein n=1 Tax=Eumeta variegata TaxID=151549 RepID=A0A4C1VH66_EUMVA|nr:hypothetical protein EVAR_23664_1 [Eumeta japonica]
MNISIRSRESVGVRPLVADRPSTGECDWPLAACAAPISFAGISPSPHTARRRIKLTTVSSRPTVYPYVSHDLLRKSSERVRDRVRGPRLQAADNLVGQRRPRAARIPIRAIQLLNPDYFTRNLGPVIKPG